MKNPKKTQKDNFIESLSSPNGKKISPEEKRVFKSTLKYANTGSKEEKHFFESLAGNRKKKPLPPEIKESLKAEKKTGKPGALSGNTTAKSKKGAKKAPSGTRMDGKTVQKSSEKRPAPAQSAVKPASRPVSRSAVSAKAGSKATAPTGEPPRRVVRKKAARPKKRSGNVVQHAVFDRFYSDLSLIQNLNAQTYLGLDIDSDKLRYVVVRKSGDLIKAVKWGSQVFPTEESDRFKALQIALENIKAKVYKTGMHVYASVFSPDINIRQITLPKVEKKADLEKAIFFKNKTDLHNFDEKSAWTFKVLGEFEEDDITKLRIMCIVVPGTLVERYLFLFKQLRMEVKDVIPRPAAIHGSYYKMIRYPVRDLIIDISYDFTQICFIRMGKLEYVRNLAIGSRNLELSIHKDKSDYVDDKDVIPDGSGNKKAPDEKPQDLIRQRLLSKIQDLKTKQNPVLHTFFSEILRSLAFLQKKETNEFIERIFITGYGIKKESLLPYLRNRLHIPVLVLSPHFEAGSSSVEFGDYFAALGAITQNDRAFSLLPSQYKTQFILSRVNMLLTATIVLSLMGFTYLSVLKGKTISSQKNLAAQYQMQYDEINPAEKKYKNVYSQINTIQDEKQKLIKLVKTPPPLTELMRYFSNETPKEVRLQKLEFSKIKPLGNKPPDPAQAQQNLKYQAVIIGSIDSNNLLADVILVNYINHLRDSGYFNTINLLHSGKQGESGRTEFQLELLY